MLRKICFLSVALLGLSVVGCTKDETATPPAQTTLPLTDLCSSTTTTCCVQITKIKSTGERVVAFSNIASKPYYFGLACELSGTCLTQVVTAVDNNKIFWAKVPSTFDAVRPFNMVGGKLDKALFKSCVYKGGASFKLALRKAGKACKAGTTGCKTDFNDGYVYLGAPKKADGGVADKGVVKDSVVKSDSKVVLDKAVVKDSAKVPDQTVAKPDVSLPDMPVIKPDQAITKPDMPMAKPDAGMPDMPVTKPDGFTKPATKPHSPTGKCMTTVIKTGGQTYVDYCVSGSLGKIDNFIVGCQGTGCNFGIPKVVTKSTKVVGALTYYCQMACINKVCLKARDPKWPLQVGYNMAAPVGGVMQDPTTKIYHAEYWENLNICSGKYCMVSGSRWADAK